MAKFNKKKRFLYYNDAECKKYLRKDFCKQCAYCLIREGDLAGPDSFEKDHFKPKALGGTDFYDNMYYSCRSCNGATGKSDTWSETLLDPCKEDILGPHIILTEDYVFIPKTVEGAEYIRTFKLNRKSYINKRRLISEHQLNAQYSIERLEVLLREQQEKGNTKIETTIKSLIEEKKLIIRYGANYLMSLNSEDEIEERKIIEKMSNIGDVEYIDGDYDLAYKLQISGQVYYCYLEICDFSFNGKDFNKYIKNEIISVWNTLKIRNSILVLLFNRNDEELYYIGLKSLNENSNIDNPKRCSYKISEKNKLCYFKP